MGKYLDFTYTFNREKCWYKDYCKHYKKELCTEMCPRYDGMSILLKQSGMPERYQDIKALSNMQAAKEDKLTYNKLAKVSKNIVQWVQDGNNMIIMGSQPGTGKTMWACRLMFNYFDKQWGYYGLDPLGFFIRVSEFLADLKNNMYKDNYQFELKLELMKKVPLIIWDDIAMDVSTSFDASRLYNIIDHRINSGKANIFTTNTTDYNVFCDFIGPRLADRIVGNSKAFIFRSKKSYRNANWEVNDYANTTSSDK